MTYDADERILPDDVLAEWAADTTRLVVYPYARRIQRLLKHIEALAEKMSDHVADPCEVAPPLPPDPTWRCVAPAGHLGLHRGPSGSEWTDFVGLDDEEFCPACLAGSDSSEHVEECGKP